jgi:taurine transport system substrate-binding protein
MWLTGENTAEMLPVIAKDAGMDEEATAATIATFQFPTVEDQLSDKWLGGGAQSSSRAWREVFVERAQHPDARDSYDVRSTPSPLLPRQDVSQQIPERAWRTPMRRPVHHRLFPMIGGG